jgi:hypothetical protein
MTLTAQDVVDLVKTTQRHLGPLRFQQIAQRLQYYEVFSKQAAGHAFMRGSFTSAMDGWHSGNGL